MAGIGDAAPRKYVIEELIRRTIGMHGNKGATSSEVSGIEDLKKAIHCIELLIEFEESQPTLPECPLVAEHADMVDKFKKYNTKPQGF